MRLNEPVTQREHELPQDATLLSTTDEQSRVTYANAAFVAASGFDRAELTGQPHNIVRHPDMPPQAFADMWRTLKGGETWTALVKNRRKNGDHYWVRANATPVVRGGRLAGYLSVRTKPARAEVATAEALYERFRTNRARGLAFHKGLVVHTGLGAWRSWLQWMPVRWRIRLAFSGTVGGAVAAAVALAPAGPASAAGLALVALAALLADLWLEAQVEKPLRLVLRQAKAVAAGAPEPLRTLDRVDEIGMLMRAVVQSGLNLRSIVDDVHEQVQGLRQASTEIAAGNGDLSVRTENTAASLQQTASAMEQLHGTVRHSADAAQRAAGLAASASTAAEHGGTVVGQVVQTMDAISGSSRRIADINAVIDAIAFQTNILALNAAVEAARAGEQGRGFAVVAGEVRMLAQRSAEAAKEIRQLIGTSVEHVDHGARLVGEAGTSMQHIVEQVRHVDRLIADISRATAEQTTGVGQVSSAVALLDRTTQQNAALVEQSAAAAGSLHQRANELAGAVKVFAS
ncbi:MAG: methyl-accepting chemotaxis protein [Rubrivivax sp.]